MPHILDGSDLDAIIELRGLRGYTLMFLRISDSIKFAQAKLEQADTTDAKSHHLRGQIEAYRTCLQIPEIIEAEARKSIEKGTHG